MKKCSKCQIEKDESEFSIQRNRPDGLSIYCRACWRIYRREKGVLEYQKERYDKRKPVSKEKKRQYNATRKARLYNVPALIERQTNQNGVLRCAYCNKPLFPDKYHVDHIRPLSRGGSNDLDNLCLACPKCNLSKGRLTLQEWRNC